MRSRATTSWGFGNKPESSKCFVQERVPETLALLLIP